MPYPVRVCLNGNEWLKQQLRKERIPFDSLDNGFLWCADPDRLQQLADSLSPADVQSFFDRWLEQLPWPLRPADRAAGYRHRLSIWQLEMSLTQVFTTPVYGRHFFEAVIRDNLDLGRPDRVSLLFPTRLQRNTPPPGLGYKTRVITYGVAPSLHVEFKHSHVKQYCENTATGGGEHDPKQYWQPACMYRDALLLDLSARRQRPDGSRDAGLIRSLSASA